MLTVAIAMILFGTLLVYAGWKDRPVREMIVGNFSE